MGIWPSACLLAFVALLHVVYVALLGILGNRLDSGCGISLYVTRQEKVMDFILRLPYMEQPVRVSSENPSLMLYSASKLCNTSRSCVSVNLAWPVHTGHSVHYEAECLFLPKVAINTVPNRYDEVSSINPARRNNHIRAAVPNA